MMAEKKKSTGTRAAQQNVTSGCRYIDQRRRTVIPSSALEEAGIPTCSIMEWKSVNGCVVGSPVVGVTTVSVTTGRLQKRGK